ncbi:MAG TPA: hypothetical protein VGA99_09650 [bacterium]
MKSKFNNVAHRDGFIYGLDDGILACLDLATGQRRWKGGRYGHGQMLLVNDLLLVITEKGNVALVEATPDAFKEIASVPAIEGRTWNNPALAGPYLLVRNSEEAACFKLSTCKNQVIEAAMTILTDFLNAIRWLRELFNRNLLEKPPPR